ncbi:MAG TPA: PAS domain S-box protein [Roseiflexaceae bacterium]|nr:PAS domain S-box protein [Roseiflexaceae bacterium]HMP38799.1 PAS domain S-box protein [Roseiflexaceae bacterium]
MAEPPAPPFTTVLAHHAADPFRLLVESVRDYAIYMIDPAGHVVSWNPGAERIYGYSAAEIVGRPFHAFYPSDDIAAGVPQQAQQSAREHGACTQEGLRMRRDGSMFCAVVTISNLHDYFGNHAGFSVVTRDVTERRRIEAAVRRERDVSEAILNSLPGIYYMYDETGRFVRWNRQFEIVTEYSAEEIARLHPLDLFDGDDRQLLEQRIASVFQDGAADVEALFVTKSGRRIPYYFTGARAEIDGRLYLLGMGIDITTRKEAEAAYRATTEYLRLATQAANVGLWSWEIQTNEAFYSAEWKRQIGYEDHEIGNTLYDWQQRVHPDDIDAAVAGLQAYVANPARRYSAEFRIRHRDGSYRWILSQGSLLYDEQGVPVRMLGSHVDVTDQRRIEQQLHQAQKMEAIGQLAAGIAHDFNNLLTVINGYSDLLLGSVPASDPTHELLHEIVHAGERAAYLTHQLLSFSRQQVLEPQVLNLNTVIDGVEKLLQRLIDEHILLITRLKPNLGMVKADAGQIEQLLINLAVNARDAMPQGGHLTIETQHVTLDEIYCRAFSDLKPGEYVLLAVSDTGHGMDEATQARIFEPFFTTKSRGKGTGLGLATVHGIVKQSHGHIAVYSELGHGTVFKVYLPLVAQLPSAIRPRPPLVATFYGSETILLVEDDDAVRGLAKYILAGYGYSVFDVPNGAAALQIVTEMQQPIQLLISDVVMPHLGGRALAEQITAIYPDCKVLFLSGYTDEAIIHHGVIDRDVAFLQKPFTPTVLAQKVRMLLDQPPMA